jgi:hypothetical protein
LVMFLIWCCFWVGVMWEKKVKHAR